MIEIKSNKIRWALSAVLALLILFGTYRNVFSLAAFLICVLMLVFCDRETNLLQIFFIMPMANIFKLSPGVQSFFTIIIIAYVVLHLVLPRKATFIVALFAVYVLVGQLLMGSFNLSRTIKLICNLLFLSSTLNGDVKIGHKETFLSYIVGNIVASVFGTMNSSTFKIESYIGVKELEEGAGFGEDIIRFAGLYADPNYYTIGLIISLCLIVVLLFRKEINPVLAAAGGAAMVYFLIKTYSKSAIIMLVAVLCFLLYSFVLKKNYFMLIVFSVAALTVGILALTGKIEIFDIIFARITDAGSAEFDINEVTTGRFDLWITYVKYLIKNIRVALLGEGISSEILGSHAAHNTYIDIFYYLGVVGGALLFASLKSISEQSRHIIVKHNIMNYSVLICIAIMYFFLSELFYFDPPFHIFLGFMVLNLPLNKTDTEEITNLHRRQVNEE